MNGQTEIFERTIDGIRYRVARPDDFAEIWALMLRDFYPHTPVFAHVGYSKPEDVAVQFALSPELLNEGLTLAEDVASGAIVGARISSLVPQKSAKRHPLALDAQLAARYPKDATVFRAVDVLTTPVDLYSRYGVDSVLEFKFLVVQTEMRSRNIAKHLVEDSLELAKLRGVPVASAIAAHQHTARIFESLGFERVQCLALADYIDPVVGGRPFEGLDPTVLRELVFFVKRL